MQRKIFKTGHSLAITVSKKILEEIGLKQGDAVQVQPDQGRIVISKAKKNTQLAMPFSSRLRLGSASGKERNRNR